MNHDAQATRPRGYRERIYAEYVSAFKGTADAETLRAEFDRHATYLDRLLGPLFDEVRPRKLLDVACGSGRILFWAKRRGIADAAGFDVSPEQVSVARSLGLVADVASCDEYLPRCHDVDAITAFDIVEHFSRDEALVFLEQCHAALRPGGAIVLTTPNGAGLRPGPVVFGDLTHETIFSPQTIRLALQLCGFERIRVREIAPECTSARAIVRGALWSVVRLWPALLDLVEKGTARGGVYSRVMVADARRRA